MDPSTVRRWRLREEFRGEVARLRLRLVGHDPAGALVALSGPAVGDGSEAAR
ncbi:hypothetical protein [Streptomyces sp. NPDC001604]|uniref:hypothetical protein n=1 Tax=Streptomyces sp. NPDC001604 TaxID=3364593 RepID=UPI0036CFFB16